MIKVSTLSKSYGKNQVLKDISISFESGKVYGIVGENGAGKTTFFNCIAGLEVHSGDIESPFSLKDNLGYLQTDPYLFDKITGREYLQLFLNAAQIELVDIASKNIFYLPLDQYAVTYSTGMKKKLALTAILIQDNDVFILDEPFNGVDIQSNIIITELIHKLRSLNKTVIISSHIFSTLKDTCDEIHHLKNGEFIKKALKHEFDQLDQEMKKITVGNRIEQMGLK